MVDIETMVSNDYDIKCHGTTVQNPQANAILSIKYFKPLEIQLEPLIYITIKTLIWKILVQEDRLGTKMFTLRATYPTTLKGTPSQKICYS
jgi:hypothetical protein